MVGSCGGSAAGCWSWGALRPHAPPAQPELRSEDQGLRPTGSPVPLGPWRPSALWLGQSVCLAVSVPSLSLLARSWQDPAAPSRAPVLSQASHPCMWLGTRSIHPQQRPSHPRPARTPRDGDAALRVHGAEVAQGSRCVAGLQIEVAQGDTTAPQDPCSGTCPLLQPPGPFQGGAHVWEGTGGVPEPPIPLSLAACGGRATRCR